MDRQRGVRKPLCQLACNDRHLSVRATQRKGAARNLERIVVAAQRKPLRHLAARLGTFAENRVVLGVVERQVSCDLREVGSKRHFDPAAELLVRLR